MTKQSEWQTSLVGAERKCSGCGKKTIGRFDGKSLCSACYQKMKRKP
jgi:hypothetical protein